MAGFEARHWHPLHDGRIQCDLCPRFCKLRDGQRGLCFVRARHGDALVLTTHGRAGGLCMDPIEKKPLYHFLPGTSVLSFGTAGCNLACRFCQNWDLSRARDDDSVTVPVSAAEIVAIAEENRAPSVAFTYNDPVIFHEWAIDVARACRSRGIRTVAVTAGYVNPAPRAEFYRYMDAANVDLKAISDDFYRTVCSGRLDPVLDTLEYIRHETGTWLEITTLLIPGLNDDDAGLDSLTRWVANRLGPDVPIHFTAFHPAHRMRDRPATPPATLRRACSIARGNGIRHAYIGNVDDPEGSATRCSSCGTDLIRRHGYRVVGWNLEHGACPECGERCPGVLEDRPGGWGGGRFLVRAGGRPPGR